MGVEAETETTWEFLEHHHEPSLSSQFSRNQGTGFGERNETDVWLWLSGYSVYEGDDHH